MEIGNVEHSMVFPYRNYMYDISQSASANGCFGSGDQTYRKIDCKLYHSNVDRNSREREVYFGVNPGSLFFAFGYASGDTVFYYNADENVESQVVVGSLIDIKDETFTVQAIGVSSNGTKFIEFDRNIGADVSENLSLFLIVTGIGIIADAQSYVDANISQADQDYSYILDPWVTYRAKTYYSDHFDQMIFPQESAFQKAGSMYAINNAYLGDGFHFESVYGSVFAYFGYNGRIEKVATYIPSQQRLVFYFNGSIQIYNYTSYQVYYIDTVMWPSTKLYGATYWFYNGAVSQTVQSHPHPSIRGFYNEIGQGTQSQYNYTDHPDDSYRWGWISAPGSSLGKGARLSFAEKYFYLNDLYNMVHQEHAWSHLSAVDESYGGTPYDIIFGTNREDFFPRYRSLPDSYQSYNPFNSSPGDLGKNSIDN
jgi:hypothetical protein